MSRLLLNALAVVAGAVVHSVLLFACSIFSFVGSFGAPQGGDAMKAADQHPTIVALLRSVFDVALWILALPCSALRIPLRPLGLAWCVTSLAWGFLALMIFRRISRPKVGVDSLQNA